MTCDGRIVGVECGICQLQLWYSIIYTLGVLDPGNVGPLEWGTWEWHTLINYINTSSAYDVIKLYEDG